VIEAINILTGSEIELNPDIKRRITTIEDKMADLAIVCQQAQFVIN
jgi:hypothetical protein